MNIFYFHKDIKTNIQYYCDKHIVKMILESMQILSTIRFQHNKSYYYKPTHINHPSTIWCGQSISNYNYLIELTKEMIEEYGRRYNKIHTSKQFLNEYESDKPNLPNLPFTKPTKAMPEYYKNLSVYSLYNYSTEECYQLYFFYEKSHIHKWKHNNVPNFVLEQQEIIKPLNTRLYQTDNDFHYSEQHWNKFLELLNYNIELNNKIVLPIEYFKILLKTGFKTQKGVNILVYSTKPVKMELNGLLKVNDNEIVECFHKDSILLFCDTVLEMFHQFELNDKIVFFGIDYMNKKVYNLVNEIINI